MKLRDKKRYLVALIITFVVIISLGTYAWLSYRTNDTAMVLTVGDINNVQITMSPYQLDTKISPNLTYIGKPYTTIEVINNSSSPRNIRLFYTINEIDSELATSNLKYTIEKQAAGSSSYTLVTPDGNFNGAQRGDTITIVSESAPVGTTYYKIYVWLYSASSAQNNVTGKKFNAELNATIGENQYLVTLNANNGEVSPGSIVVDAGGTYQNLPIPTRQGYVFMGWNGKNMFNEKEILLAIQNATYTDGHYVFTSGKMYALYGCNGNSFPITNFKNQAQYTLTVSGYIEDNAIYFPLVTDSPNYSYQNYIFSNTIEKTKTYTTEEGYTVSRFCMTYGSSKTVHILHIQLEEGTVATEWEPYYITNGTSVVQNQNHTLTAIWEKLPSGYQ